MSILRHHTPGESKSSPLSCLRSPEAPANAELSTREPGSAYAIEPIFAFYAFLVANLISAIFAPIQDCDETFNYWEPTHYLSHGYGLQTWEYSPDYAIRSWLYIALHAIVGNIRRILPQSTKVQPFCGPMESHLRRKVLTRTVAGRVLLCSICPRLRLCFLPDSPLQGGQYDA